MGLKTKINQALIAVNAYLLSVRKRKKQLSPIADKTVLIVFQQIFGDSVLIQDSLAEYMRLYPKEQGYTVKFLTRPSVLAFMQANLVLPDDMQFESMDFKRYLEEYSYYRQITKHYCNQAKLLIIPGVSLSSAVFACSSNAKRRVAVVRHIFTQRPFVMSLLERKCADEYIHADKEDMYLQRQRKLLNHLGANGYLSRLSTMKSHLKFIESENYCVLSLGSSMTAKCWPLERFACVADYIVESYGMGIVLCGGADETIYAEKFIGLTKHPDMAVDHTGKTSFEEWASIVEYADLVVGNDSATLHMAAAYRRKAVCVNGLYDKYQVYPYCPDIIEANDRLPLTEMIHMPCEDCRTIGYFLGSRNTECKKAIDKGLCALCIDVISVDSVISQIQSLMEE